MEEIFMVEKKKLYVRSYLLLGREDAARSESLKRKRREVTLWLKDTQEGIGDIVFGCGWEDGLAG